MSPDFRGVRPVARACPADRRASPLVARAPHAPEAVHALSGSAQCREPAPAADCLVAALARHQARGGGFAPGPKSGAAREGAPSPCRRAARRGSGARCIGSQTGFPVGSRWPYLGGGGTSPLRIWASFPESMLPPETMQTSFPFPACPLVAAATQVAPSPPAALRS